jgi:TusA-related sulfurtransferase
MKEGGSMVEMVMEDERVERLRLQQIGEEWIQAITGGEMERLEGLCQPDVASQILTPRRYIAFDNLTDLIARIRLWFGDCRDFQVEHSRVEPIGERLGISYRFLLQEAEVWEVIEQQVNCTLQDGRIARLQLLCSGFELAELSRHTGLSNGPPEEASPNRDALLVLHGDPTSSGATCAILTPAIKSKLREMVSGQVLEVRVDDPAAMEDIEAWCRLSGNSLVRMNGTEGQELQFFVKKK